MNAFRSIWPVMRSRLMQAGLAYAIGALVAPVLFVIWMDIETQLDTAGWNDRFPGAGLILLPLVMVIALPVSFIFGFLPTLLLGSILTGLLGRLSSLTSMIRIVVGAIVGGLVGALMMGHVPEGIPVGVIYGGVMGACWFIAERVMLRRGE